MRYASYLNPAGGATWGAEAGGQLHDLGPSGRDLAASLQDAITGGLLATPPSIIGAPVQEVEDTTFLPVVSRPVVVSCYSAARRVGSAPPV